MRKKQLIFVSVVIIFSLLCVGKMNIYFDPLSRYAYEDEEAREIIKTYLTDDEIEYIIEYSIQPSYFIRFAKAKDFNVYHVDYYEKLEQYCWFLKSDELVAFAEIVFNMYTPDDIGDLLSDYRYDEIMYWAMYQDQYNSDSKLVEEPSKLLTYLDDVNTVSIRTPSDLVELKGFKQTNDDELLEVSPTIVKPLKDMCAAISSDLNRAYCGGLLVDEAYISYQKQKDIYLQSKEEYGDSGILMSDYPGHCENQLGTSVNFGLNSKIEFKDSKQFAWLEKNAYKYGFVRTYKDEFVSITQKANRDNHYRYVGVEVATVMQNENISLKEYLNK